MVDVARPSARPPERVTPLRILAAVVLLVVVVGVARMRPAVAEIANQTGFSDTVRLGVFTRTVRAAGTLVPERIQWISALSAGRVERILVAPGQTVAPGTPLMQLTNPDVTLEVLEAERQLGAAQAGLVTVKANLETQLLTQEATLATLRSSEAEAVRRARAQEELARSNVAAPLEVSLARDQARELTERLAIEKQRKEVLSRAAAAQLDVQRSEIARLRAIVAFQRSRETALRVVTPVGGVVQDIPHEPGQWVDPGEVLAKVVSPDRLKAVLRVPEGEADGLMPGLDVLVDMRSAMLRGRVSRADPAVQNGVVRVDVMLLADLPAGARPDLTVDGTIEIERAPNVLHVARPPHVQAGSTVQVFRRVRDSDEAERTTIRVGRVSASSMEVLSGLEAGDVVLLIDPADIETPRVRIKP